jgi:hypothetical protein
MNWPRYMLLKRLLDGSVAYYWNPHIRDIKAGFTLKRETLGPDYALAIARANELNQHLDAWRGGRDETKDLDLQPGFGTLKWLIERYKRSPAWKKVSQRSRPEYERALNMVLEHKLSNRANLGSLGLNLIDARGVDKLYEALQKGVRVKRRLRQANLCMGLMARAWDVVHRLYPATVPAENPFRGVELEHGKGTVRAASREETYALHAALIAAGEPYLAAVPLICFEWHQRPENVLAGHLTWADYKPSDRPNTVRIEHHKTGEMVPLPLSDRNGALFPELTAYLDGLERLGVPIVLMKPERLRGAKVAVPRPFLLRTARIRVRAAARAAKLPDYLTLAACRHGGITELGDAELTEQGVMAMTGHKTSEAARLYLKRTEKQRAVGARRRRAFVELEERSAHESQNRAPAAKSE